MAGCIKPSEGRQINSFETGAFTKINSLTHQQFPETMALTFRCNDKPAYTIVFAPNEFFIATPALDKLFISSTDIITHAIKQHSKNISFFWFARNICEQDQC
jgi:hypothetical protein